MIFWDTCNNYKMMWKYLISFEDKVTGSVNMTTKFLSEFTIQDFFFLIQFHEFPEFFAGTGCEWSPYSRHLFYYYV